MYSGRASEKSECWPSGLFGPQSSFRTSHMAPDIGSWRAHRWEFEQRSRVQSSQRQGQTPVLHTVVKDRVTYNKLNHDHLSRLETCVTQKMVVSFVLTNGLLVLTVGVASSLENWNFSLEPNKILQKWQHRQLTSVCFGYKLSFCIRLVLSVVIW